MSKPELQQWLISRPGFRRRFLQVLKKSVSSQFSSLAGRDGVSQIESWGYLLFCASILADSARADCQDIALRLAQGCLTDPASTLEERDAAAVVLDDLANRLAVDLSVHRNLLRPGLTLRLGTVARMEWTRRSLENSISLTDHSVLSANRFQKEFWRASQESAWTSASAPTSAGKSFIILQRIADFFLQSPHGVAVYIVPTRALIHQVETDFRNLRQQRSLSQIAVSSIPLRNLLRPDGGNFFVFTQERLHLFLSTFSTAPHIDLIIVDEAHKVGDGQRGVLLQDVIERVVTANAALKVIFASPQTENPETLLSDAPNGVPKRALRSNDITVNQNLIWATQVPRKPKLWEICLCLPEELIGLGELQLQFNPTTSKRLPFVAQALSPSGGGNLLYVDGAADAENTAQLLFDLVGSSADVTGDADIVALIELVKNAIHDQYSLARVLQRGIAFHYGNMPLIVRNEIERCFKDGHINYLICTSTLIEGVNLPCRNIFVRGPKKGRGKPMNEGDFWNLAGRAGRWGREFQGNVICVDATNPHVWKLGTPRVRSQYRIERTTDRILEEPETLIQFIESGMPAEQIVLRPELEFMGSYLVASTLRAGSILTTSFASRLNPELRVRFASALASLIASLTVDGQVVLRNPGISPVSIDNLLKYFKAREGAVEELIPVSPTSEDAVTNYIQIFSRINRELTPIFGVQKRIVMLAMLVTSWMRGHPLKRLISERLSYEIQRVGPANISSTIRGVMKDVEEVARFQAPKYLSCYIDVLKQYLAEVGRSDLLTSEFDINMLLEFGVPGGTQLSLMGLGLSRTSALALAEFIASDELSEEACIAWLKENDWRSLNLPVLVKRDIDVALRLVA